ncbi:MAG: hypothetical protein R2695_19735 [Acidimicrobiales bacterium]
MGHHFESDLAREHPHVDLTDLFCFPSGPSMTAFVICVNPASVPSDVTNLSEDALLAFHLSFDRELRTGLTMTFRRDDDMVVVGRLDEPVPELGDPGRQVGAVRFGATAGLPGGGRVFAGTARDPFSGNAIGLRAFRAAAAEGIHAPESFDNAENFFVDLVTTAIVFELPNDELAEQIHYHGTSAWFEDGHWHRANRIGHVLFPHLYSPSPAATIEMMTSPITHDAVMVDAVAAHIAGYAARAGHVADPVGYGEAVARRLLPDMVPYRPGTPADYAVDGPNGRRIDDLAMDVALHWLVGGPTPSRVGRSEHAQAEFPFLVGHGRHHGRAQGKEPRSDG